MTQEQPLTVMQKLNAVLELLDEGEPETAEERRAYLISRGYDPDKLIAQMRAEIDAAIQLQQAKKTSGK